MQKSHHTNARISDFNSWFLKSSFSLLNLKCLSKVIFEKAHYQHFVYSPSFSCTIHHHNHNYSQVLYSNKAIHFLVYYSDCLFFTSGISNLKIWYVKDSLFSYKVSHLNF